MKIWKAFIPSLLLAALCGCGRGEMGYSFSDEAAGSDVVIFYAAVASNGLGGYISQNLKTIYAGVLPQEASKKVFLVYNHANATEESFLVRVCRDGEGQMASDTLHTVEAGKAGASPEVISEVLSAVKTAYPGSRYTLILSSHGSGWMPEGAFNGFIPYPAPRRAPSGAGEDVFPIRQNGPVTKSFGTEKIGGSYQEINMQDLAAAIPMHLDCLVFDACFMGGVEVAWEFRGVADKMCFSPAEVPGNGYIYTNFAEELISDARSPENFARTYFEYYEQAFLAGTGADASYGATSTAIDCRKMDALADVCKRLFEKYRSAIAALPRSSVQPYFRKAGFYNFDEPYFFDLEDILIQAGMTRSERTELEAALDECITYKAATTAFMPRYGGFQINIYSGLSMYLPSCGTASLDDYYKTLGWNIATSLVE